MATLWNDLRHGARLLARRPGLTVATLLILGLGLGATAALFSLVNGLLLKPLPGVEDPESLVLVGRTQDGDGFDTFGYLDYRELREAASIDLAAVTTQGLELRAGGGARWTTGSLVTGNYFSALGTRAAAGRLLLPRDTGRPGEAPVAVLGHGLARELFDESAAAIGESVQVNGVPLEVVGVAEEGFHGGDSLTRAELWLPVTLYPQVEPPREPIDLLDAPGVVFLIFFGRLAPDATPAQAEAELTALHRGLETAYPEVYEGRGVTVVPGFGLYPFIRDYVEGFSLKLLAVVALVLVIVCANVANLQLARVSDRRLELGVRLALGAGRGTLVRQALAESVLLAVLGGGLGLLVAAWSQGLLELMLGATPLAFAADAVDLAPDARVLAVGFALALLTGLLAGAVPALHATRGGADGGLRSGGSARGGTRSHTREGLVVAQIALSLVLLALAGLYVRSLGEYRSIDPGFDAERVWTAGLRVGGEDAVERAPAVLDRVLAAAAAVPGVEAAGFGRPVPLAGSRSSTVIQVPGRQPPDGASGFGVDVRDVTPGYLDTLGLTLLAGRGILASDAPAAARVAVVNRTMAERLWSGRTAVGEIFQDDSVDYRVVGVVDDMKYLSLTEEPRLHMFRAFAQHPAPESVLHVRAAGGDPRAIGLEVRRALADAVPEVVLFAERTLGEQLSRSIGTARVAASITSLFGALALALAAAGLGGTLLYYVRTHRHEIGVRMALGADASRVVRLVVGRGLRRVALGVALGAPAALAAARALESELYGVDPGDPWTLAGVAAVLFAVA
ncbi:MAG TPA: ADOP family duplicated permease, partial [Thermoanaerobaculia bacterium]|nr:ADOP family duplicated permease [Thermoanaerobaculia bacterium]